MYIYIYIELLRYHISCLYIHHIIYIYICIFISSIYAYIQDIYMIYIYDIYICFLNGYIYIYTCALSYLPSHLDPPVPRRFEAGSWTNCMESRCNGSMRSRHLELGGSGVVAPWESSDGQWMSTIYYDEWLVANG
jgi:hypothetical protein